MLFQISARKSTPQIIAIHAHCRECMWNTKTWWCDRAIKYQIHEINLDKIVFWENPFILCVLIERFRWNFHQKIASFPNNSVDFERCESDNALIFNKQIWLACLKMVALNFIGIFYGPTTFRSSWKIVFFVNANGSSENYYWLWSDKIEKGMDRCTVVTAWWWWYKSESKIVLRVRCARQVEYRMRMIGKNEKKNEKKISRIKYYTYI